LGSFGAIGPVATLGSFGAADGLPPAGSRPARLALIVRIVKDLSRIIEDRTVVVPVHRRRDESRRK